MQCQIEQYLEEAIDDIAEKAADTIRAKPDWRRVEYGFLIYSGPNGLRLGTLTRGNSSGVNIPLELRGGEELIARVHSHPRGGIGAPSNVDRNSAQNAINAGYADQGTFSDYILNSDDNSFNEYDFPEDYSLDEPTDETSADVEGDCNED